MDSGSLFLDLNSNGELVTRALADLHLSANVDVLSGGGYNDDNPPSGPLHTPAQCVVACDVEAEPVEARNFSSEEQVEKNQWAALSSIHKGKSQEFCIQVNSGMADVPATSTPKKQKRNGDNVSTDTTQIMEGRFEGSGYHRDGTRVGMYQQAKHPS